MARHLPGGFVNAVVRIGDTVHRPPPANAGFVHDLLDHFERQGWAGAPGYLGMDADGREVLSFLEGRIEAPPRRRWRDGRAAWRGLSPLAVACWPTGGRPFAAMLQGTGARCPPSRSESP